MYCEFTTGESGERDMRRTFRTRRRSSFDTCVAFGILMVLLPPHCTQTMDKLKCVDMKMRRYDLFDEVTAVRVELNLATLKASLDKTYQKIPGRFKHP